jgi:peroxiredoxin
MKYTMICTGLALLSAIGSASLVRAESAPDFPPGMFSDGGQYQMNDFKGKLLVLFFYESECPTCKGLIPTRNKVVEQFRGKPVKFIAISPHNNLFGVRSYISETKLEMPVFSDSLNIMETLYGQKISLNNIYQFRYIGPDGKIMRGGIDFTPEAVEKALAGVKWKYKDDGYHPALSRAVDLFEWNQYEAGMRVLMPMRKSGGKAVTASAEKLFQAVHAEGEQWKQDADGAVESDPVHAYDLYTKIGAVFVGDPLGKSVAEPLKKLKTDKKVQAELSARQMYAQINSAIPRANPRQKADVVAFCKSLAARYPDTPTAGKATALASALEKAPSPVE